MRKSVFILACLLLAIPYVANADQNLVDLAKKVRPAVVLIETFDKDKKALGQGSGFFINDKGYLITNLHVIDGAYSANVKTLAGGKYPIKHIIGKDVYTDTVKLLVDVSDISVPFLTPVAVLPFVGEDIAIVGNPFGLESTVSKGIVSAVRHLPNFGNIVQISAPVSAGSSGSPVLNMKGQVIGVATFTLTEGQSLNFAIPSEKILSLKVDDKPTTLTEYAGAARQKEELKTSQLLLAVLTRENAASEKLLLEAIEHCERLNRRFPADIADVIKNNIFITLCLNKLGREEEALHIYKQNVSLCKKRIEAITKGKLEDIKILRQLDSCYVFLARSYEGLGAWEKAIEVYNKEIELSKTIEHILRQAKGISPDKKINWRDYLTKPNEKNIGSDLFLTLSGRALTYMLMGSAYKKLGRYQEAIEAYRKVPFFPDSYLEIGHIFYSLGQYQNSIEAYKQAIKISPGSSSGHFYLGITYSTSGRYEEATKAYKQSVKIEPNNVLAHFSLGFNYLMMGDTDSALEEYKILKTLDKDEANELFNLIYK